MLRKASEALKTWYFSTDNPFRKFSLNIVSDNGNANDKNKNYLLAGTIGQ